MARYIDAEQFRGKHEVAEVNGKLSSVILYGDIVAAPTADVVEVEFVSEQIIRKKAEVSDYWQKDVKQYRSMQGYSDIEHDVDNFLRGYNEAIEDILAILGGEPQKEV